MIPSQPHSLFVRDRTQINESAGTSIDHLRGEVQFLRDSKEYRIAIEKELETWVDTLMESQAVDRQTLKRAVSRAVQAVHAGKADLFDCRVSMLLLMIMIRWNTKGI